MKAKKEIIDKAIKNGTFKRVNVLISASHILMCVANNLFSEAGELLEENQMVFGELKPVLSAYHKAADRYFKYFSQLVLNDSCKMDMFNDMEEFERKVRDWAFNNNG